MILLPDIMDLKTANKILSAQNIPPAHSINKIEVGFTNDVYSLDEDYIREFL
jgi:hypothetical protein